MPVIGVCTFCIDESKQFYRHTCSTQEHPEKHCSSCGTDTFSAIECSTCTELQCSGCSAILIDDESNDVEDLSAEEIIEEIIET